MSDWGRLALLLLSVLAFLGLLTWLADMQARRTRRRQVEQMTRDLQAGWRRDLPGKER